MIEFEALNGLITIWTGLGVLLFLALAVLVPFLILICWYKLKSLDEKDLKKKKDQYKQDIVDAVKEIQKADSVSKNEDKK